MKYVVIIERKTGNEVERMGPIPDYKAERVLRGVEINLDHVDYEARMEDADD